MNQWQSVVPWLLLVVAALALVIFIWDKFDQHHRPADHQPYDPYPWKDPDE